MTPDNKPDSKNIYSKAISDARRDGSPEGTRVSPSNLLEIQNYLYEQEEGAVRKLISQITQGNTIKGQKIANSTSTSEREQASQ